MFLVEVLDFGLRVEGSILLFGLLAEVLEVVYEGHTAAIGRFLYRILSGLIYKVWGSYYNPKLEDQMIKWNEPEK